MTPVANGLYPITDASIETNATTRKFTGRQTEIDRQRPTDRDRQTETDRQR